MDQATQLRRLVRETVDRHGQLAPGAPIVALSGARADVGVTTLACQLARELGRLGKRVTLVDANLPGPAVATEFDAKSNGGLAEVLSGRRSAVEVLTPVAENIRLLAGGDASPDVAMLCDEASLAHLAAELAAVGRQSDAVLVDLGHGMNPWIDRLWQLAQRVLLVAAPDEASLIDAYTAIKLSHHDRLSGKLNLIVSQIPAASDAARLHARLDATCRQFLGQSVDPPSVLPRFDDASPTASDAYCRAVRLLAADLTCDFRAIATRVPTDVRPGAAPRIAPTARDPVAEPGAEDARAAVDANAMQPQPSPDDR